MNKIIDATDSKLIEKYQKLINERRIEKKGISYTENDIMLVRTTDIMPDDGVIKPFFDGIVFGENGCNFLYNVLGHRADFNYLHFCNYYVSYRSTVHFTENGLVSSHMQGNFDGRDFIILEPLSNQIEKCDFRLFAGQDTFIKGEMKLSKDAIILVSACKFNDLTNKYPNLLNYNLYAYKGDSQTAVEMLLYDLGYIPETIGSSNIIPSMTSHSLEVFNKNEAVKRGVAANIKHCDTKEYEEDNQYRFKLCEIFDYLLYKFIIDSLIDVDKKEYYEDYHNRSELRYIMENIVQKYGYNKLKELVDLFNRTLSKMREENKIPSVFEILNGNMPDIYENYEIITKTK